MEIVEIPVEGYERVVRAEEPGKGFLALIAVHDTTLGPALGGLRMWNYPSFAEAEKDVLRLARGMTYKSALARTGLGGGKAVICGDPRHAKSDDLFLWVGRFIESLGGRYITAEDVGIDVYDLDLVARETSHVTGRSREVGGSGDPSPYTALGTFLAIQACVREAFGSDDLEGRRVAIQGLGHVGYWLAKHLHEAGARLIVSDLQEKRTDRARDEFKAEVAFPDKITGTQCDVFAPCALGAVINDQTLVELKAPIICGAANNQLAEPRHALALHRRGILYAPDFVVNAGGIINISVELQPNGYDETRAVRRVKSITNTLGEIFDHARRREVSTAVAANEVAERLLEDGRREKYAAP